jgi:LPS export ABC transporter protein LptC
MSKIHAALLCLVGLILAGIAVGLIHEQQVSKGPEDLVSILPKNQDVSLNRIHQVATRDGAKEWMLDATSAQYDKAKNRTILKDLSATFFLKDGRKIQLTSRHGVLLTDTNDMEVSKDVVVRSGPYELETQRLFYDHKRRSIATDMPIIVRGNGVRVTGKSMLFSLDTERAVLTGAVETVFENWRLWL